MTTYVLDASVAAKWFLPASIEPLSEEAHALLEGGESTVNLFLVPDHFWIEMGNIIWKAVRRRMMSAVSAQEALDKVVELKIPTVRTRPLITRAYAIAAVHDRPLYDCLYIALAIESRRPLLTADEKLCNALGSRFPIRWLGGIA